MRLVSVIGVIAGANVAKAAYCTQEEFSDLTGIITVAAMTQGSNTFTSESGFVSAVKGGTASYSTHACASCFDAYISAMYPLYGNPKTCNAPSTMAACMFGFRDALNTLTTCATGSTITGDTTGGSKSGSVAQSVVIAAAVLAALAL